MAVQIIGGSDIERAYSIDETTDGGYITGGYAFSKDGDVIGNHGSFDAWILKLNSNGTIKWQKSLGGSDGDDTYAVEQTIDGGYIIGGSTNSNNGDVKCNHTSGVLWIIKLDSNGIIKWQQCIEGIVLNSLEQTSDEGYVVAGWDGVGNALIVKLKPDAILPVTTLALTGKTQGKQNLLHWATATEQNNAGFEVQRSNDGHNFNKIGFVNTKAVNGNSNFKLNYDFADIASAASANYYRLKQIDKDGKFIYSNIILLKDQNDAADIYSNPVKNILNIKIASTYNFNVRLLVTDLSGKVILMKSMLVNNGKNILQLDVSQLSAGSYILKIISDDGKVNKVRRFIKE